MTDRVTIRISPSLTPCRSLWQEGDVVNILSSDADWAMVSSASEVCSRMHGRRVIAS